MFYLSALIATLPKKSENETQLKQNGAKWQIFFFFDTKWDFKCCVTAEPLHYNTDEK